MREGRRAHGGEREKERQYLLQVFKKLVSTVILKLYLAKPYSKMAKTYNRWTKYL